MGEENSNVTNLDLNLGSGPEPRTGFLTIGALQRINRVSRLRAQRRWNHLIPRPEAVLDHLPIPPEPHNISRGLNHSLINSSNDIPSQVTEGTIMAETSQVSSYGGDFFECNICLEVAKDPVVTFCGHLFCWPCIFQWLRAHPIFGECPVCKGHVAFDNVIPIYGRGNNTRVSEHDGSNPGIPSRPQARRIEGMRQTVQRNEQNFAAPQFDLVGNQIGRRSLRQTLHGNEQNLVARQSDLVGLTHHTGREGMRQTPQRNEQNFVAPQFDSLDSMLNHISRGVLSPTLQRIEQNFVAPQFDLMNSMINQIGRGGERQTLQTNEQSFVTPQFDLVGLMLNHTTRGGTNNEHPPLLDGRDSFSSTSAFINSTREVNVAVEINSMTSLSMSSSRRRHDASGVSDAESGNSRASRRSRLN